MTFSNEQRLLRRGVASETSRFVQGMTEAAIGALREDLTNEDLKEPADAYVARANSIAMGVADGGALQAAVLIYQELLNAVDLHMTETNERRHRGTLLANQAALNMMMQRYDVGIPLFQYVVHVEDPTTYQVAPEDSFGNQLRRPHLDDRALHLMLKVLADAKFPMGDRPPSRHELESTFDFLGESSLVLYGVIVSLEHNIRFALDTGIRVGYMPLRMFDAYRTFAFFLEELIGRLATVEATRRGLSEPGEASGIELRQGLEYLFGRQDEERSWWDRLSSELTASSQRCRGRDIAAQSSRLEELAERTPETPEDTLVTSLAVLHIVRNVGAHEIYPPAYLVAPEIHLERVLAWLTAAAILLQREYIAPIEGNF